MWQVRKDRMYIVRADQDELRKKKAAGLGNPELPDLDSHKG